MSDPDRLRKDSKWLQEHPVWCLLVTVWYALFVFDLMLLIEKYGHRLFGLR